MILKHDSGYSLICDNLLRNRWYVLDKGGKHDCCLISLPLELAVELLAALADDATVRGGDDAES